MATEPKIFIQIASYRDRELIPTIRDAISQAEHPGSLHFGICWQFACDEEEQYIVPLADIDNCRIIMVPASMANGVCWARAQTQSLWRGEEFTLQIDSHTRFAPSWDTRLIEMLSKCPAPKAVISAYPPAYSPPRKIIDNKPAGLVMHGCFEGIIRFSRGDDNLNEYAEPQPGMFIGAGFIFAKADFITDIPYDPIVYFDSEEILLSVQAWSHGWSVYHPNDVVCWHYYSSNHNKKKPTHWQDQEQQYLILRMLSKDRYWKILDSVDSNCTESGRELAEFERLTGIDFKIIKKQSEKELLLACVRTRLNPTLASSRILELVQNRLDWEYVIKQAYKHAVWPSLYQSLQAVPTDFIDSEILEELRNLFIKKTLRNQFYVKLTLDLMAHFSEKGIVALPVNQLLKLTDNKSDLVSFVDDFSFIINYKDIPEIKGVLVQRGYQISIDGQPSTPSSDKSTLEKTAFINTANKHSILLHYGCFSETILNDCGNLKSVTNMGKEHYVLTSECLLVALFYLGYKLNLVNSIYTGYLIESMDIDWNRLMKLSSEWGVEQSIYPSIVLANELLDINIPEQQVQGFCSSPEIAKLRNMDMRSLFS